MHIGHAAYVAQAIASGLPAGASQAMVVFNSIVLLSLVVVLIHHHKKD